MTSALTKSAKGEQCTLLIFPFCNQDPATTVFCHFNSPSKGMGIKSEDWFGAFGCSTCHDIIDKRRKVDISNAELLLCMQRGLHRTWVRQIDKGLIQFKGQKK